jgi:hypothetical protein
MRSLSLMMCLCFVGCAGVRPAGTRDVRSAVVRSAQRLLGEREITLDGRALPADCWSLPVAAYARSGRSLGGGNAWGLYRAAAGVGKLYRDRRPRPGDLVFTEASEAHQPRGEDVHVGLVGDVDEDGTVLVYQRMARGVVSYRMNLAHPDTALSPATHRPWNDRIAAGPGVPKLAGQLFTAYASFLD